MEDLLVIWWPWWVRCPIRLRQYFSPCLFFGRKLLSPTHTDLKTSWSSNMEEKINAEQLVDAKIRSAFEDTLSRIPDEETRNAFLEAAHHVVKGLWIRKIYDAMEVKAQLGGQITGQDLAKLLDEALAEAPDVLKGV